jgi:hypothetical protein
MCCGELGAKVDHRRTTAEAETGRSVSKLARGDWSQPSPERTRERSTVDVDGMKAKSKSRDARADNR